MAGPTDVEDPVRRAEAERDAAVRERAELWAEVNRLKAVDAELAEVRRMLTTMQGSPSWRLTAPLRKIKATLHHYRSLARRAGKKLRAG